ncbi:MAG: DUF5946 family protein [Ignavibacteriaceae bacterium]
MQRMSLQIEKIKCQGCGSLVYKKEGQPHKYIGATQGCWDLYGQILAKEYLDYNYPELTHRLTVDTYAVQHPGRPGKQSIKSVNVHLISLYLILELGVDGKTATTKIGEILSNGPKFKWLDPPVPNGQITVIDVLTATNKSEHEIKVRGWAEDVWSCWNSKHKPTIKDLINDNFLKNERTPNR